MLKILLHSVNQFCIDSFQRSAKNHSVELIITSNEADLFEHCSLQFDGYMISADFDYTQRAISTIRGINPRLPIVSISHPNTKKCMPSQIDLNYVVHGAAATDNDTNSILCFIEYQFRLYSIINSLSPPRMNEIYFGEGFKYDVVYRTFYLNGIALKRFSTKEGKLLEMLAKNYRSVIKRDLLLEEVWHKTDIYSSRSADVHISKLRNFFKEYDLDLSIKNISGVGLILE